VLQIRQSRLAVGLATLIAVYARSAGTCARGATRWIESMLFTVKPNDPWTIAEAAALLFLAASVAAFVPARRASRVDPVDALRRESWGPTLKPAASKSSAVRVSGLRD
jgi:ABC-type antimicrobial peptide transport system permease subunit